jgi:hypothetical protein
VKTTQHTIRPYAAGVVPHSPLVACGGSPRRGRPCIAQCQPRFAAPPRVQDPPQCATDAGNGMATHVFTPKALDSTAQGQPRFAAPPWVTDDNTQPYAEGVTPHSPDVDALRGAPWVTDDNTHPYAEGVTPRSPESTRFAAHPGSRTTTRTDTPKGVYKGPQSR